MKENYNKIREQHTEEQNESIPKYEVRYTTDRINVRSTPEVADNVLYVVEAGTKLTVVDQHGEWSKLRGSGYVMTKFIKE